MVDCRGIIIGRSSRERATPSRVFLLRWSLGFVMIPFGFQHQPAPGGMGGHCLLVVQKMLSRLDVFTICFVTLCGCDKPNRSIPQESSNMSEWHKSFVPFVDWGNGDASGYVFSESGIPLPGIFIFEHDNYDFEEDQDWKEFLIPVDSTICAFLTE